MAILDIDKFKNINDTYGHDEGDNVIIFLSNLLQKSIRNEDILARFGGEEFVVLFPHTSLQSTHFIMDRLRHNIQEQSKNEKIAFTVSIGISELVEDDYELDCTLKRADEALYIAKNNGRNKVEYKY